MCPVVQDYNKQKFLGLSGLNFMVVYLIGSTMIGGDSVKGGTKPQCWSANSEPFVMKQVESLDKGLVIHFMACDAHML